MPAARIFRFARTRRCAIAGSATRNACAISVVVRPPTSRSVKATRLSAASAGWQQVKTRASRSSGMALTSSSSAGSSCRRPMSSAFCWKTFSRRMRSIARLRAVVTRHAPGGRGMPSRGQRSRAVVNASCTASSASSRSPRTRVRIATALDHSSRKTRSTSGCTQALLQNRADLDRARVLRGGYQCGEPDRLVEVGQVDDEDAAEDLLRLRERAVGHEALAVADPYDLRGAPPVELLPGHVRVGLAELLEERQPVRHLLRAQRSLLLAGQIDPRRV